MLAVKDLSVGYLKGELILKDLSFSLSQGKMLAIIGPNGAGKTTLLRCINAILKPNKGVVEIEDQNVFQMETKEVARKIGYVSQNNKAGNMTVFDAVLLGRNPHVGLRSSQKDLDMAGSALGQLNLSHLATRYTNQLSGGELQKVCIARALVQQPELFLLDEPTSNLDLKNQMDIMKIVRRITTGQNLSTVMTVHDLNLAFRFADYLLLLNNGHIVTHCPPQSITPEVLTAVYGVKVELLRHNGHILADIA